MTDSVPKPSASVVLPLFPKERPLASEVGEWIDAAKPLLHIGRTNWVYKERPGDGVQPACGRSRLVYDPACYGKDS